MINFAIPCLLEFEATCEECPSQGAEQGEAVTGEVMVVRLLDVLAEDVEKLEERLSYKGTEPEPSSMSWRMVSIDAISAAARSVEWRR